MSSQQRSFCAFITAANHFAHAAWHAPENSSRISVTLLHQERDAPSRKPEWDALGETKRLGLERA